MSQDFKVVMLGGGGVGKSAVTINFIHSHFVEIYDPTIEDSYRKQVMIDGEIAHLDILDTAGQEDYSVLRDQYMRSGEGFILVYDVTNAQSFNEMTTIYERLERARDGKDIPLVLLGNKVDLVDRRQVTTFMGQELAKNFKAEFFETSAKSKINIDESFAAIVRAIRKQRNGGEKKPGGGAIRKSRGICIVL